MTIKTAVSLVAVALLTLAASFTHAKSAPTAQPWVENLAKVMRAGKNNKSKKVRISHCGPIRKSDISIATRKAYPGTRPAITVYEPKDGARKAKVVLVYLDKRIYIIATFTCHHIVK